MPKFDLRKVQKHLAKAMRNTVRVNANSYFRNTYGHLGEEEALGEDIEFVHKTIVLRRFADNDLTNDNKHAGFSFTNHAHGRARLREGIAAFDVLDKVLKGFIAEPQEEVPTEVNLKDLEDF